MSDFIICILPLTIGWLLDLALGDPSWLPHPIVGFGHIISFCEKRLNLGCHRKAKGALMAIFIILLVFVSVYFIRYGIKQLSTYFLMAFDALMVFYCLAGTTLIHEVKMVFKAVDRSIEDGRKQVARIVGRDTSELSPQEIRTAALETLAENLSDGVVAPLFWFVMLGIPGMITYKMINTLDSMIGYRTERYREFGCWAAHIDDVANYIPARLTAFLMVVASGRMSLMKFVNKYGRQHASPNSGYPEAALAGILDCRFGGPHYYFGELFDKPYIGHNIRLLTTSDMNKAIIINRKVEIITFFIINSIFILI